MSMTLFEAGLRPTDVELRDYQLAAIDAIRREFAAGRKSTLLILPTGCGKTITFGMIARRVVERGGRALVLAHRGELIDQAVETLTRLGLDPAIEKADRRARALGEPEVVVATVQTLQRDRLTGWPADHFRLLITDEAHHATADTYRRVAGHFQALHLGVTATADRADEEFLGDVFESVAFEYSLWDAMTAPPPGPYLARVRFVQCDVGIDLRSIRTTGGDLNQADLEEAIRPHVEALANSIRQEVSGRKTLCFTPDVGSAQAMAAALADVGVAARWVAGDSADRGEIVAAFRRGEFQALCNCALLTEGFDCPDVAAIALCRPTKSRPLYAQMVGRGTRLAPGKADCLLVDFDWLTEKHKLVKPVELFDTTHTDDEVLGIAAEMARESPGLDLVEAVERAEAEHRRRLVLRVRAREQVVRYRRVSYDPLAVMETLGVPVRQEAASNQGTITPRQKAALERFGMAGLDGCSRRRASLLMDRLVDRARRGLATVKQVSWLIKYGIDPAEARGMTREEAGAALDRFFGKREEAG